MGEENDSGLKVLVMDPIDMFRRGLVGILAHDSRMSEVVEAATTKECTSQYQMAERLDAVILGMESGSAGDLFELASAMREHHRSTPILFIGDRDEHIIEAFTWNAAGYLSRNVSQYKLMEVIWKIYSGATFFDAPLASLVKFETELTRQYQLSRRELEVLRFLALGKQDGDIAGILGLSFHTVRAHVRHALYKLGCKRRFDVVTRGFQQGYLTAIRGGN